MNRVVNFALLILIVIAFFVGLNWGKRVQSIDTPVKKIVEKVIVTVIPSPTIAPATPSANLTLTPKVTIWPTVVFTPTP